MPRLHLPIQNPCHEDWDAMNQDGASRRFCEMCTKHVHDLSTLTEPEARQVLAVEGAKGRVCVRYTLDGSGHIKFKAQTVEAPNLWRMTLAAASVAVALLTGCADSEPDRIETDHCTYEVGPWSFEVARGEGTCPASVVDEPEEPIVMGELEAVIEPVPEPIHELKGDVAPPEPEPEVEKMGEMVAEPMPKPRERPVKMGKIAAPKIEEVEMMGDVAELPDEPCEKPD